MEQSLTLADEPPRAPAAVYTGRAGKRGQGPFMEITLEVADTKVAKATFETYGCPSAIRCGDWVTKWAVSREPNFLLALEASDLEKVVGGLPAGKQHCAELAVNALKDAVRQVMAV